MWVVDDMNIRTAPGGDRITTLPDYTEITVIGYLTKAETNSEYDWLIIEYETAVDYDENDIPRDFITGEWLVSSIQVQQNEIISSGDFDALIFAK